MRRINPKLVVAVLQTRLVNELKAALVRQVVPKVVATPAAPAVIVINPPARPSPPSGSP